MCTPVSVYYSSTIQPKYKAETVFEKAREVNTQNNSSLLNNIEGSRLFSFISGMPSGGSGDSFYSEIRSDSLLKTVILNNDEWVIEPGNYNLLFNKLKSAILLKQSDSTKWESIKKINRKRIIEQ